MQVFRQPNEVARELGVSEWRIRAMRKRGELQNSACTTRGDALFSDDDIRAAKERLGAERKAS